MKRGNKSEAANLRQKAEDFLDKKSSTTSPIHSESETLRLVHELEVHQIELELQNEELILANQKAEVAVENYTELFDFTPACYYKLSKEGEIIDLNLSGAHMLGKEPQHLSKNRFAFFVSNDSKPIFNLFLGKVFNTQIIQTCEVTLLNDDNQPMYVYLIGLVTKNGEECHINMIDITERKQAEGKLKNILNELTIAHKELEQLVQLNNDKNLFISILAHDLKSPLGVLLGLSDLLTENIRQFNIDKIEKLVNEINLSAQNTFTLLQDLLKWSRVQSGKIPFEPQNLSFTDICKDIIKILNPNAVAKNITINYSLAEEINVFADVDMLKAVLRNLVSNSIKFTNNGGAININTEVNSGNVTISVSDNGIGIEPESLTKLFDISKIHTTTGTAKEKGTGLGLLLCKEFVEKHGGKIWVESECGKGSIFYFNIPYNTESKEKNVVLTNSEDNQIKNLKILIVDDNELLRIILYEMVKKFGKEFLYAKTGVEAVTACHDNPDIDLILMDYLMPEMDGYEATRQIRLFNKEVVIILQTAYVLSNEYEKAIEAGCNGYISKPINKTLLYDLIKKHCNK
jgi:signal transduction histidine kinase/CheY-like chemotaxis protein